MGGGVRDVLLQRPTKDYDVATDATPEQIRKCFVNSRIIGRRFRLVHVYFHGEIIEVSALKTIYKSLKDLRYSEYMTMFFLDNPEIFFKSNVK